MVWEMVFLGFRFGILMINVNMSFYFFDCLFNECKFDFEIDVLLLNIICIKLNFFLVVYLYI